MRRRRAKRSSTLLSEGGSLDAEGIASLCAEEWHLDRDPLLDELSVRETCLLGERLALFRARLISAVRDGRLPPPVVVRHGIREMTLRLDGRRGPSHLDVLLSD